jgi:hypothetical protein
MESLKEEQLRKKRRNFLLRIQSLTIPSGKVKSKSSEKKS